MDIDIGPDRQNLQPLLRRCFPGLPRRNRKGDIVYIKRHVAIVLNAEFEKYMRPIDIHALEHENQFLQFRNIVGHKVCPLFAHL